MVTLDKIPEWNTREAKYAKHSKNMKYTLNIRSHIFMRLCLFEIGNKHYAAETNNWRFRQIGRNLPHPVSLNYGVTESDVKAVLGKLPWWRYYVGCWVLPVVI